MSQLRDFISFESDPRFGTDVHNASAEVALQWLPEVIDAARINSLDRNHPNQGGWFEVFLRVVQYPVTNATTGLSLSVADTPKAEPKKQEPKAKRLSRRG